MTGLSRLAAIQTGLAAGQSRRAIARSLGVSDKTVRTALRTADPAPAAEFADYIPPGEGRVIPVPTMEQRLFQGGVSHPGKAWISCPGCGHPAWRDAPGIDAWTCGCPVGPHGCHRPTQVVDAAGIGQIAWTPYRIRPFPGLQPDPDAAA